MAIKKGLAARFSQNKTNENAADTVKQNAEEELIIDGAVIATGEQQRSNAQLSSDNRASGKLSAFSDRINKGQVIKQLPIDSLKDSKLNFFSISEDTVNMIKTSIEKNGLLQPIIVRALTVEDDEKPMYELLAGHTRVRAYKKIIAELEQQLVNAESQAMEKTIKAKLNSYQTIKAIVANVKSDDEALEIICDTNFEQRTLSPAERATCIYIRIKAYNKAKQSDKLSYGQGTDIVNVLMNKYGMKKSMAYLWLQISKLDEELFNVVYEKKLHLSVAAKLAHLELTGAERAVVLEFKDLLTNKNVSKLEKDMDAASIKEILTSKDKPVRIKTKTLEYSTKGIRKNEKPMLVFVDENQWQQFEEYIKAFGKARITTITKQD